MPNNPIVYAQSLMWKKFGHVSVHGKSHLEVRLSENVVYADNLHSTLLQFLYN